MTHWGVYWKIKKNHKAKKFCSQFPVINSFDMFKNKQGLELTKHSKDRTVLEVPGYNLRAILMNDNSLSVSSDVGSYIIRTEKKPCNYGGFYYFFHCPQCDKRMRKLYLVQGKYLCRKCGDLKYYSQRLRSSVRALCNFLEIEESLKNKGGSLSKKPPRMKRYSFRRLQRKSLKYDEKYFHAANKELLTWYGAKILPYIEDFYIPPYLG